MKSSRDIQPRVGMQLSKLAVTGTEAVYRVVRLTDDVDTGLVVESVRGRASISRDGGEGSWDCGEFDIQWQPPTDDERRLFMEAARHSPHPDGFSHDQGDARAHVLGEHSECCYWCNNAYRAIAESLALDGADPVNMPFWSELEEER